MNRFLSLVLSRSVGGVKKISHHGFATELFSICLKNVKLVTVPKQPGGNK